jgi:hypothetical protein
VPSGSIIPVDLIPSSSIRFALDLRNGVGTKRQTNPANLGSPKICESIAIPPYCLDFGCRFAFHTRRLDSTAKCRYPGCFERSQRSSAYVVKCGWIIRVPTMYCSASPSLIGKDPTGQEMPFPGHYSPLVSPWPTRRQNPTHSANPAFRLTNSRKAFGLTKYKSVVNSGRSNDTLDRFPRRVTLKSEFDKRFFRSSIPSTFGSPGLSSPHREIHLPIARSP